MPTSGEQQYDVRDVVLPAGGRITTRWEWMPDQILLLPKVALTTHAEVYLTGMQGGSYLPLFAMGPMVTPGLTNPQSMTLVNNDASARTITIVAQKGYPPTQIVPPTTLVAAESANIQAQTRYADEIACPAVNSFMHNHVGSEVIVFASATDTLFGSDVTIASVTVGGVAANLLGTGHIFVTRSAVAGVYHRAGVPEGNQQITVTLNAPVTDGGIYIMALSFAPGIRTGNVGTLGSNLANPPAMTVNATNEASVTWAMAFGHDTALSETSAAPEFDGGGTFFDVLNCAYFMHWRAGIGVQTFDYQFTGGTPRLAAVALEILPRL